MKQNRRTELFLILTGGTLLVLHAVAVCVRLITSGAAGHDTFPHSPAYLAGEILAVLCFSAVGFGLLALAWAKRGAIGTSTDLGL